MKALDVFMCWIDIQDFKSIPVESYRRSKALHIYHKYIKTNAILQIKDIPEADRAIYKVVMTVFIICSSICCSDTVVLTVMILINSSIINVLP